MIRKILPMIVALACWGCGADTPPPSVSAVPVATSAGPPSAAATASDTASLPATGDASIRGVVKVEGKPPVMKRQQMSEAYCIEHHGQHPPLKEDVIVNSNGTLKNVIVAVVKGLEGRTYAPPAQSVLLDQIGCLYKPHVLTIQVGQTLLVRNSDPIQHNIHSQPIKCSEFNIPQVKQGDEDKFTLDQEEIFKTKCDIHPWMGCHIGVFRHPFSAVTGEDGSFRLDGLPPGEYVIQAWHESRKVLTQTVKVGQKETKEIAFTFRWE